MPPHSFSEILRHQLASLSITEVLAVAFGIAQVLLARRNSIWNYAAGIISTLLSIWLMLGIQLFAEAALNAYYFFVSIWGIYAWRRQTAAHTTPSFTRHHEWRTVAFISIVGTAIIALLLHRFTSSDVPVWDAAVSAIAWAGTWLLTRRRVENWLVLNASNALAIPLQIHKGIYLYALLTTILFVVALDGYRLWRKQAVAVRVSLQ